jgi:hypothetical protein
VGFGFPSHFELRDQGIAARSMVLLLILELAPTCP